MFISESAKDFEFDDLYLHFFVDLPKCEYCKIMYQILVIVRQYNKIKENVKSRTIIENTLLISNTAIILKEYS